MNTKRCLMKITSSLPCQKFDKNPHALLPSTTCLWGFYACKNLFLLTCHIDDRSLHHPTVRQQKILQSWRCKILSPPRHSLYFQVNLTCIKNGGEGQHLALNLWRLTSGSALCISRPTSSHQPWCRKSHLWAKRFGYSSGPKPRPLQIWGQQRSWSL